MDETVLREPSQAPRGLNGRPGLREEQVSRRRRWTDERATVCAIRLGVDAGARERTHGGALR